MTSPPPDLDGKPLELLIKLMSMTKAEDNIALIALKKANAHLEKLGTDWESVLRGKVKIIADPFANINIPTGSMNPNRNQDYKPAPPRAPSRPQPTPPPRPQTPQTSQWDPDPFNTPPPPPRPAPKPAPVRPKPGVQPGVRPFARPFAGDTKERSLVNKFDGTCTKCKNRVLAGDGLAHQWKRSDSTTYWTTEHNGPCPTKSRKRPLRTSDDFQI